MAEKNTEQLARFTLGEVPTEHDALNGLWAAVTSGPEDSVQASLGQPTREDVTVAEAVAGLRIIPRERRALDWQERDLIELCLDRGVTWSDLAAELDYASGDALRQRYRRLGGERTWPAGRRSRAAGTPQAE